MTDAAHNKADGAGELILLVGGSSDHSQITDALCKAGFSIISAVDCSKAFEQISQKAPSLIIVDSNSGLESVEICDRLKKNLTGLDIPTILLCGTAERNQISEALKAGATDFILKPWVAEELLARVRLNVELARARQRVRDNDERLRGLAAEKNEFLSIVAHDLRSPLSNIVTSAEILVQDPEMPHDQLTEFLQIISSSGKHLIHLVENLMDLNAIEQGRLKLQVVPCELGELVREVVANYDSRAKAKQQQLAVHEEDGPLMALADPNSAVQIFDNLLSNAIKYSPAGKRIDVRVRRVNGKVRCEVQDQGPGLTGADLRKMFGKFAKLSAQPTAGEPSTGLGLSIVKKMVDAAGGNVWCETEPGKGSTFVVELRSAE